MQVYPGASLSSRRARCPRLRRTMPSGLRRQAGPGRHSAGLRRTPPDL